MITVLSIIATAFITSAIQLHLYGYLLDNFIPHPFATGSEGALSLIITGRDTQHFVDGAEV